MAIFFARIHMNPALRVANHNMRDRQNWPPILSIMVRAHGLPSSTFHFHNELRVEMYHLNVMFFATIMFLLSCNGPPPDALSWREQWELIVLTEDGGIIEGLASVGNTGMFRGEGQFRARRLFRKGAPIIFEMDGGPADVDVSSSHDSVRIGSALIGQFEDGEHWTVRFAHDEANAIIRVDPGGPNPPMATTILPSGQWTVASPISHGRTHGWFTAGRRGGMFEGMSIALHRGGDGRPGGTRQSVVLMGPDVSIGIDTQGGQRMQWARIGDHDLPLDDFSMSLQSNGSATLDFRPTVDLVIELVPTGVSGSSSAFEHLLSAERWLAENAGLKGNRQLHRARARFTHEGVEYSANGFTLTVD